MSAAPLSSLPGHCSELAAMATAKEFSADSRGLRRVARAWRGRGAGAPAAASCERLAGRRRTAGWPVSRLVRQSVSQSVQNSRTYDQFRDLQLRTLTRIILFATLRNV
eukprot:gene7146-biopygen2068